MKAPWCITLSSRLSFLIGVGAAVNIVAAGAYASTVYFIIMYKQLSPHPQ